MCSHIAHVLPFHGIHDNQLLFLLDGNHRAPCNFSQIHVKLDSLGHDEYLNNIDLEDNLLANLDQRNFEHCNHMTMEQMESALANNCFSIAHLNIRSLAAHLDKLEITMSALGSPHVIGLCETWLRPENELLYCLPGYFIVTNSRVGKSGGGVALLISEDIHFTHRPDLQLSCPDIAESVFVEIELRNNIYILCEIYRPPTSDWAKFITYMSETLDTISRTGHKAYILGDYNVDLLKYPDSNRALEFVHTCASFSLLPMVSKPT